MSERIPVWMALGRKHVIPPAFIERVGIGLPEDELFYDDPDVDVYDNLPEDRPYIFLFSAAGQDDPEGFRRGAEHWARRHNQYLLINADDFEWPNEMWAAVREVWAHHKELLTPETLERRTDDV